MPKLDKKFGGAVGVERRAVFPIGEALRETFKYDITRTTKKRQRPDDIGNWLAKSI